MKKIVMLLIPVFCFGLFAVTGCAPEAPKAPAPKNAPAADSKAAPAAPADNKKEEPKK